MLKEKIKSLAQELKEEVISNRRHLHANPELSYQEFETANFVKQKLEEIGVHRIESKATTGWTALIEGKNPTKKGYCATSRYGCSSNRGG